jgi:hypothetical protein
MRDVVVVVVDVIVLFIVFRKKSLGFWVKK